MYSIFFIVLNQGGVPWIFTSIIDKYSIVENSYLSEIGTREKKMDPEIDPLPFSWN